MKDTKLLVIVEASCLYLATKSIISLCKSYYNKGYRDGAKDMTIESIKIMTKDDKVED